MVDDENTQRVAQMSAEEREEEVGELKARFGSGLEDLMRWRREKREGKQPATTPAAVAQDGAVLEGGQAIGRDGEDENARRVAGMSDEERRTELKELEERFGSATLDALRARALQKQASSPSNKESSGSGLPQPARKSDYESSRSFSSHRESHAINTTSPCGVCSGIISDGLKSEIFPRST